MLFMQFDYFLQPRSSPFHIHAYTQPYILQHYSGYNLMDISSCLLDLHRTFTMAPKRSQKTIRQKYFSQKWVTYIYPRYMSMFKIVTTEPQFFLQILCPSYIPDCIIVPFTIRFMKVSTLKPPKALPCWLFKLSLHYFLMFFYTQSQQRCSLKFILFSETL